MSPARGGWCAGRASGGGVGERAMSGGLKAGGEEDGLGGGDGGGGVIDSRDFPPEVPCGGVCTSGGESSLERFLVRPRARVAEEAPRARADEAPRARETVVPRARGVKPPRTRDDEAPRARDDGPRRPLSGGRRSSQWTRGSEEGGGALKGVSALPVPSRGASEPPNREGTDVEDDNVGRDRMWFRSGIPVCEADLDSVMAEDFTEGDCSCTGRWFEERRSDKDLGAVSNNREDLVGGADGPSLRGSSATSERLAAGAVLRSRSPVPSYLRRSVGHFPPR